MEFKVNVKSESVIMSVNSFTIGHKKVTEHFWLDDYFRIAVI